MASKFPQDQYHIENCSQFCSEVEALVATKNMGYIESVLALADKRGIEEALAASYLSPDIQEKIRMEAENLNFMKRTAALPF